MNRLVLSATLAERAALRFTPAGLPALDLVLAHESELVHEGQPRKVSMQLKALAIGSTVSAVASMPLGSLAQFVGFVAPARNGRGWIFHITEVHG
jgi:primosomal replication protein N